VVLFTFAGDTWRTDLMFVIGRYRQLFCKTKKCGTTAFPFLVSPIFSPIPLCSFLPSPFSLNPVRECVESALSPPQRDPGLRGTARPQMRSKTATERNILVICFHAAISVLHLRRQLVGDGVDNVRPVDTGTCVATCDVYIVTTCKMHSTSSRW